MQKCDPRLMTPREIVSELASVLSSCNLRHVKTRRFMDEGGLLPADVALGVLHPVDHDAAARQTVYAVLIRESHEIET